MKAPNTCSGDKVRLWPALGRHISRRFSSDWICSYTHKIGFQPTSPSPVEKKKNAKVFAYVFQLARLYLWTLLPTLGPQHQTIRPHALPTSIHPSRPQPAFPPSRPFQHVRCSTCTRRFHSCRHFRMLASE